MNRWLLGIVLVVALGGVGTAQADYEDGQRAWDAGRHSEALREWQASANAGDAKAMLALGRLYEQGLGVPQNYVQAHKWFSLAASRFEAEAVKERDALAARMAPEQVAKAQEQAAAWQPEAAAPAASADAGSASPPPPKAIREAQQLLAALGYEPDSPDGQWGERTAQAYQAFVRDANLPKTDTLTPAALKTMRAMARQAGATSAPKPRAALPPDALHRAAKAGNLKGLESALAAGADVNARDDKGWTPLMYVVDKGYVLLVEPVLTAKADPDVRAPDGATALFMVVAHGHSEIIPLLMKAGADPTIKGPKGKMATEVAQARYGEPEAAREKGADYAVIALLNGRTWEDFMFKFAQGKGTPEAYTEYLSAFPHGRHADEATDAEAFARADSLWTVEAYAEYLAAYPSGRHVEKARRWQASLERVTPLTATSTAGTSGRECAECPEMVVVPGGLFRMGDLTAKKRSEREMKMFREGGFSKNRLDDMEWTTDFGFEGLPPHDVTIAPFAVGKYEVTFAEWDACVAAGGCTHRPHTKGWGRGTQPVIDVSWADAQEYVRWLSRKTGKPYRLLSEAEWEYVARAGTTTQYWWGNEAHHDYANYGKDILGDDDFGVEILLDGLYSLMILSVGSFEPNAFGLFDTAGNVEEWVEDCWNKNYRGAPINGSAWKSGNCDKHVLRGGSWNDDPRYIRSARRDRRDTGFGYFTGGFRVARTLD